MKAHRICADYTPETFISKKAEGEETVCNVANIGKDRLELKCNYCRSKRGAVFQCSQKVHQGIPRYLRSGGRCASRPGAHADIR